MLLFFYLISGLYYSVNSQTKVISEKDLEDKIYASWLGQIIGNIYGLPHENAYIDEPGPENFPYGYGRNLNTLRRMGGGYSDDDTDFEYMYLLQMEKHGVEPTYEQLAEAWRYHVRDRVWLANRAALGLMNMGYTPPATGMKDFNPHWFQIDPQLINEIWAVTAPGMIDYAVEKSAWAAKITNDDWGIEPTMFYGAMYSAAFFEKDINKLINIACKSLPENCKFVQTVKQAKELFNKYPDNWISARKEICRIYYYEEPELTRTIWNANLNGACAILALLYGKGDFQKTLDYSCAMGFDADNQAATISGLLGLISGTKGLPKNLLYPIDEWKLPFNDNYRNVTRYDLPDAKITDMAKLSKQMAEKIILKTGGRKTKTGYYINTKARFYAPLEFTNAPLPILNSDSPIEYQIPVSGAIQGIKWEITSGNLPNGLLFENGVIKGKTSNIGQYPVEITISDKDERYSKSINLIIRPKNLALDAEAILTNVPNTNETVRNEMWYSFGKSLYAKSIDVIRDGKYRGDHSVFYSIINNNPNPKIDFYGYQWNTIQEIGHIGFHVGAIEENGGSFSSLNIQYLDENGIWKNVKEIKMEPNLANPENIVIQPGFIEYFITFQPIKTKAIRIIGDATLYNHWHAKSKQVSPFTSITELAIYQPFL